MTYKVIFPNKAQFDLLEIWDYIERMSFLKETANKIVAEIISSTQILKLYPYMYPKVYKTFHSYSIKNRRVFYEIDDNRKEIIIYHILWWFQDYENII